MIRQLAKRLFPTRKKKQGVPLELIEQITLGDPFASLLRSMYSGAAQLGTDGAKHSLHPTTLLPPAGGMLLYRLFREIKPAASLEIGLAYGYSTIYILAALKANGSGHHLAIDPFQESSWCGIGITRQEVLGLRDIFEF